MTVPSNLVPTRISELPTAGTITGTELVPVVQNGVTKRATAADLAASPSQTQSFVVVNSEASLPNERTLAVGSGLSLVDGGAGSTVTVGVQGELARFRDITLTGIVAVTGSSSAEARTIASGSSGISVSDGDGVSGNPTISAAGALASLQNLAGTGSVMATSAGNYTLRTLTGTSNQITITNATGVSGDPTFAITNNPVLPGAESVVVPSGTTAQRPGAPSNGMIRYNTDLGVFEGYKNGSWETFAAGTGVTSVATGTGLTGGPITSTGTISLANTAVSAGSYGSATAAPTFTVDAQGRLTAAATVTITPAFASITATPTTLSGYGITDGVSTSRQVIAGTGLSGGGALTSDVTLSLASTIAAGGPTGSGSVVPVITYNAQGQLTAVTTAAITPASIGGVASVAGTANEITATGTTNVTLSLPAALTFTGKTVTGGTFSSPTITVATLAAGSVAAPSLTTTGDTNTGLYFPAADTIAATTGGSERMRIDSSGNVGIGTSSIAYRLQTLRSAGTQSPSALTRGAVLATTYTRSDNSDFVARQIAIGATEYASFIQAEDTSLANVFLALNPNGGNVGIGTASPGAPLQVVGAGRFGASPSQSTGACAIYNDGNNATIEVFAGNNSATKRDLLLQTYGGNVGIGTSSPDAYGRITSTPGATQVAFQSGSAGTAGYPAFGFVGQVTANGGRGAGMYLPADNTICISTLGAERLRIDGSGNVGIGTSSPTFKLVAANSTTDGVWLYSSGAVSILGLGCYSVATDGAASIRYDRATGAITLNGGNRDSQSERMRIDTSGNVGIGTSSPGGALSVYRATGTAQWSVQAVNNVNTGGSGFWQRANGQHEMVLRDASNNANFITNSSNNLEIVVNGSERMRIESTGRLKVSYASNGVVTALTDGATITPDFNAANNYSLTIGGNRTLANPTNQTAGQSGAIVITQDATGSRTLAYGSNWKFAGGSAPTLTTTANAVDVLLYYVESASRITATLINDVK